MAIKDYSTTPDMNTTISGINIAEGCAPSGINNAIRQLMADVKVERDETLEAQTAKDAAQDAAIQQAQTAANNAQSAASAAQTTATNALNKANSITVPVTSVNGKTGAVEVGTVRSINGVNADANGAVTLSVSAPVTSVNGMTGAVTISSVATATKATILTSYKAWGKAQPTLPSGGTWAYFITNDSATRKAGTASGGSTLDYGSYWYGIAFRIS